MLLTECAERKFGKNTFKEKIMIALAFAKGPEVDKLDALFPDVSFAFRMWVMNGGDDDNS